MSAANEGATEERPLTMTTEQEERDRGVYAATDEYWKRVRDRAWAEIDALRAQVVSLAKDGERDKLSAAEFVEMREERDDALSRLGAAECARDEYRATVNSVCKERDQVWPLREAALAFARIPKSDWQRSTPLLQALAYEAEKLLLGPSAGETK